MYIGDYKEDATVYFKWSTNDLSGASITRATDGTIKVYKDASTTASAGTEITNVEDWNSTTGVHHCTIDTSALAYYVAGADYFVIVEGTVIDGQTVNHPLRHFSIENRSHKHMVEDAIDNKFSFSGANVNARVADKGVLNDLSQANVQSAMTAQGYTSARAANLDNLDQAISALNDLSITDVQTALTNQGYTSARAALLDNLDKAITALNDLSITDVQTALTNQGYTSARAPNLDNLDATISSVNAAIAALNDLSIADVQTAVNNLGYTSVRASNLDNLDAAVSAVLSAISALNDLGITDVQTALDNQGYTAVRATKLDNLDKAISALNDLSQADVQTAMTAQGYTIARAALLDNLDKAISALNDLAIVDIQTALTNQGYTGARADMLESLDKAIICAKLTVQAGSTALNVRTNATPGDDFYDYQSLIVVGSSGAVVRRINNYTQINGIFTLEDPFPFIPQAGDLAYVISTDSSGYRLNYVFGQQGILVSDIKGAVQGKLGMYYYRIIPTARNAANKMTAGTKKIYYNLSNYNSDTPDLTTYIEVDWSDETATGYVTAIREHK